MLPVGPPPVSSGASIDERRSGLHCSDCDNVVMITPSNSMAAVRRASKEYDEHLLTHGITRTRVVASGYTYWRQDKFGRDADAVREAAANRA